MPASTTTRTTGIYAIATLAAVSLLVVAGCKSTPRAATKPTQPAQAATQYPARPSIAPPPFKVFHQTDNSITLTTLPNATDAQIEAIIWQLHDAARVHAFASLGISQKFVDARSPIIWFHIYRGTECADEKYTNGPLPCGSSYHAAGDYTLGGFTNPNHDEGALVHGDDNDIQLWDPNAPTPSTAPTLAPKQ